MRIAEHVFLSSHHELACAQWDTTFASGPYVHSLMYRGRHLEVRLAREDLAVEIRCDDLIVEILRVKQGELVDRQDTRIAAPDAYFGFLVLGVIAPDAPSTVN